MTRELWKGNEAIAEAAIRAGLKAYFGYPITPQTELLEWMARRMPELGRAFVQAESEVSAINMVYGAACTGSRVMTSSSGPGISLMMEGISYITATEVPAVIVDVMRGGPGLGNIQPSQSDYNQIVHGGGHGDYHNIVLAPANLQEAVDLTTQAFDLADKYRALVFVLLDGALGQLMEPVEMPPMQRLRDHYPNWAVTGAIGRERRLLSSILMNPLDEELHNFHLERSWEVVAANESKYKEYNTGDARFLVVGFGSAGRIALSAVRAARAEGIPVGLFRPISLSPFPSDRLKELSQRMQSILVVEMNNGQMLEDVLQFTENRLPVEFYGRTGGVMPMSGEILDEIRRIAMGNLDRSGHPRHRWLQRMPVTP